MIYITVAGYSKSGKTTAIQAIVECLRSHGMRVVVKDRDKDFKRTRPIHRILQGGEVIVEEVQMQPPEEQRS